MKLQNCCCGGLPEVTCKINRHNDFVIACANCDNSTPKCDRLGEAVSLWNQVYYCALPPYEFEIV